MTRRFPYPRWLQLELTPLEQLSIAIRRPWWALKRRLNTIWHSGPVWRLIGEPLRDRKFSPWAEFSPETGAPVLTEAHQMDCRTRHGAATLYWNCFRRAPQPSRARNALLPDGTRGDVQDRGSWWRRKGSGDKLWIIGSIDIRADEITFTDAASQDLKYEPPAEPECQFERELASHRPFVEALADDKFAAVAHSMLQNLEWMRIGARETGCLCSNVHGMIADLRNKGEDYLDYKLGYAVRLTDAEQAAHARRMKDIMRSLGWRTHTADEIAAMVRDAFRARVERRLDAWRQMTAYEARPANSHDIIRATPAVMNMPMFEGDDMAWLDELRDDERLAASSQFTLRLKALAASGRLSDDEYRDLCEHLFSQG
jgi:hypothetical protein